MSRDQVNQTYDGKGLNHSQLKSILAERFSEEMPDFVFAGQIEGTFYFQRIRNTAVIQSMKFSVLRTPVRRKRSSAVRFHPVLILFTYMETLIISAP
jgi:hypothetical protein